MKSHQVLIELRFRRNVVHGSEIVSFELKYHYPEKYAISMLYHCQ